MGSIREIHTQGAAVERMQQRIKDLRIRFGIQDWWNVPEKIVIAMSRCEEYRSTEPIRAAIDWLLYKPFIVDFRQWAEQRINGWEGIPDSGLMDVGDPSQMSLFALGEVVEFNLLADHFSNKRCLGTARDEDQAVRKAIRKAEKAKDKAKG